MRKAADGRPGPYRERPGKQQHVDISSARRLEAFPHWNPGTGSVQSTSKLKNLFTPVYGYTFIRLL